MNAELCVTDDPRFRGQGSSTGRDTRRFAPTGLGYPQIMTTAIVLIIVLVLLAGASYALIKSRRSGRVLISSSSRPKDSLPNGKSNGRRP